MSHSSIVPCTAVVRVQPRLIIFTMCGVINGVIVGSLICVVLAKLCKLERTTRCEYY